MKRIVLFALLFACGMLLKSYSQEAYVSPKIRPYIDFIENCNTSPVDYVMGLFEKYDIVILGERDHRDTTQYDLIEEIVSDPRFIEKVGHVMTEAGVYNMTDEMNRVLKANYTHDTIFKRELFEVCKNADWMPVWDATAFYQCLFFIHRINCGLPDEKKINITMTDPQFSWRQVPKDLTQEEFDRLYICQYTKGKDILLATNAIDALCKIFDGPDPRKKALIIYNAPHSCRFRAERKDRWNPAAELIFSFFPRRVANVMLNWAVLKKGTYLGLTNGGKWDAAFAACGNKSIGFDLAHTVFGDDPFDTSWLIRKGRPSYADIYTGFIFYKPVKEWVAGSGIPLKPDPDFAEELAWRVNRYKHTNYTSPKVKKMLLQEVYSPRSFSYYNEKIGSNLVNTKNQISKYYKSGTEKDKEIKKN